MRVMLALARTIEPPAASEEPGGRPVDPRVAAMARGDRTAAEELLLELLPRIRNLVRYLIGGDAEVDDVAQEAVARVFRHAAGYRGEGSFEAWVDRIVARATFRMLHRRRRSPLAPSGDGGPDLLLLKGDEPHPEEYVARRELVGLLDRLPAEQREVVVLHHAVGLTVAEIAAETATHPETVRYRLRVGLERLRELGLSATSEEG